MTTDAGGLTTPDLEPDPAAAAARVTGAADDPPAPSSSRDRVRRHRARKRQATGAAPASPRPARAAVPEESVPIVIEQSDIDAAVPLGRTIWDLVAPMARLKSLDDEQALRLGTALAPLVKKYLPLLGAWQHEVNFALVVFALVRANAIPREVATPSGAETVQP